MLIYLQLILAMFFYGLSFVSTKVVLASLGPITILWIRLLLSACFLILLDSVIPDRRAVRSRWPHRADLGSLLLVTLFQPLIYFVAETTGLQYVSASIASIIIATIPVFTPVFARPFLGERIRPLTVVGLLLSLAGVATIVLERRIDAQFTAGGLALVFTAVLAAVGYTIAVKRVAPRYRPLSIVKLQSLFGLPVLLVLGLSIEGAPSSIPPPPAVAHLLYLGIFPSSLAFVFLSTGIRKLGANRTNVFVNLVPVFTAVVAWTVLGEVFTVQKILGMAVVIAGVLAAQRGQSPGGPRSRPAKRRPDLPSATGRRSSCLGS